MIEVFASFCFASAADDTVLGRCFRGVAPPTFLLADAVQSVFARVRDFLSPAVYLYLVPAGPRL